MRRLPQGGGAGACGRRPTPKMDVMRLLFFPSPRPLPGVYTDMTHPFLPLLPFFTAEGPTAEGRTPGGLTGSRNFCDRLSKANGFTLLPVCYSTYDLCEDTSKPRTTFCLYAFFNLFLCSTQAFFAFFTYSQFVCND